MKFAQLNQTTFAIRLEPGEYMHQQLQDFCDQNHIPSAAVSAIGSFDSPTLAHYRMDTKKFTEKRFEGVFEIVALSGNISQFDGRALAHLHAVIGDSEMTVRGGHLVEGKVSAIAEVILTVGERKLIKEQDDEIGLKAWKFE